MPTTLTKRPAESRLYNLDFAELLATGETLLTIVSVAADTPDGATALTLSGTAISGTKVQVRIAGGTALYTYEITATVTTSDGNTLQDCGLPEVAEC